MRNIYPNLMIKMLSGNIKKKLEEAKQELQESYDQEKYVKDSCNY